MQGANMKKLLKAIAQMFTVKKPVKISYEQMLRTVPEKQIEWAVISTLERARDFYAMRGRTILAVDLQTHLDFFKEAVTFDELERRPVLLPTNKDNN
jgi:hypothetical protein